MRCTSIRILVLTLVAIPAAFLATTPGVAQDVPHYLYVANQGSAAATIIDMDAMEVVEVIDLTELGFTPEAKPHHAAVEPDGSYWYLSLIGEWRVLKFDRDNKLVGQAPMETPGMLVVDPVKNVLYAGRSMSAVNPPQRIGVIDRDSMSIEEADVFIPRPHALAVAPEGGTVYTASLAVDTLVATRPADEEIELVQVPGAAASEHPGMDHGDHGEMVAAQMFMQFIIGPDGNTMVVGGEMSGLVTVFDISDRMQPTMVKAIPVGNKPWDPCWSPDGRFVYFPQNTGNSVAVIDTSSWEVVHTISAPSLAEPHGSAISHDGRYLFVAGRNLAGSYKTQGKWKNGAEMGTVTVIDTATREVVKVLEVPPYAAGVGAQPAW